MPPDTPSSAFRGLFPARVLTLCDRFDRTHPDLLAGEDFADGSTEPRKWQFACSRHLARQGFAQLGLDANRSVPRGPGGAPRWPGDAVGSISYKGTWCAVAMSLSADFRSIGVDLESMEPSPESSWSEIVSRWELEQLDAFPGADLGELVNLAFAAKEAVFKAQYPLTNDANLEFLEVELEFDREVQHFRPRPSDPLGALPLKGTYSMTDSWLAAGVICSV